MGSKRWMLQNGLGDILISSSRKAKRFVDLFTGSAAVASFVARQERIPVLAYDLQQFSAVLARAVVARVTKLDAEELWSEWFHLACSHVTDKPPTNEGSFTQRFVNRCRSWCKRQEERPVTKAYGGHYFSPEQALWFDAFRRSVPPREPERSVSIAALIQAASRCAASPGHTAQPFQPTAGAKRFLAESWRKNVAEQTKHALFQLAPIHALRRGSASVGDANTMAHGLKEGDLVFIDPPYSGVHYSRFYHVLETIARGDCGIVSGTGRYPEPNERPRSRYSIQSESEHAFEELLETVAENGAAAILTYPNDDCSNGLSGGVVRDVAQQHFKIVHKMVKSRLSTLGGTKNTKGVGYGRAARKSADELILLLRPK